MTVRIWFYLQAPNVAVAASNLVLLCSFAVSLAVPVQAEDSWKIEYFYDQSGAVFDIRDLRCPSPRRCIGAGVISDKSGREQGATLITTDGGSHWAQSQVKEHPVALFFLDDTLGWMVTDRGIWATGEGGRSWNKLESLKGIVAVYFLDASHGFAIGSPKALYETFDGGRKWMKLAVASDLPGDPQQIAYDNIAFAGPHGVIAGSIEQTASVPFRRNPDTGVLERAAADDTLILATNDAGKSWIAQPLRFDGKLSKLSLLANGMLIAIVDYAGQRKQDPSAVFGRMPGSKERETIFAQRGRAVLDIALLPNAGAVIAAVEPPGNSNDIPIPSKMKMLASDDLKVWREMRVDYRAVAQQAVLAAPDAGHIWVATDTGMILRLVKDAPAP